MKTQNDILNINADELRVIAEKRRKEVDERDRIKLLKLILTSIKKEPKVNPVLGHLE